MFDILYYTDDSGNSPIEDYIKSLVEKNDKDSRIKANKILDYLDFLAIHGKRAGEPYVKHLDGEIWELRPLRDRFLFATWDGETLLLLHHFIKETKKTPQREIRQAKRNLRRYRDSNKQKKVSCISKGDGFNG